MKFSCTQTDLLLAINTVSKSISNRSSMPILTCMLLKIENGELYLIGTDLELSIKSKINANIIEEGQIALDAKLFPEIIRRLSDENIEFETDPNNYVTIKCSKAEYKLAGQPGEDYPKLPEIEKKDAVIMFQDELRNMIKATIFSIAADETKPILTGELLEIENNEINLVAVDGFRISYKKGLVNNSEKSITCIIPGKNLGELSKILSTDKEDKLNMYFTDKHVLFELEDSLIISRLLEGKFINYKQNLIDNYTTSITVSRVNLLNAVERMALITGIDKKQPIKFEIKDQKIMMTSSTTAGMGYEEIEVCMDGDGVIIAFNPKFLLDILKAIEDDEIILNLNTSISPCIIKATEEGNYKYLVLPLRLNN